MVIPSAHIAEKVNRDWRPYGDCQALNHVTIHESYINYTLRTLIIIDNILIASKSIFKAIII